jgi:hypothetical protein
LFSSMGLVPKCWGTEPKTKNTYKTPPKKIEQGLGSPMLGTEPKT